MMDATIRTDRPALSADLDPQSPEEWEAARRAGYRLVDQLLDAHRQLREAPCWQSMPAPVRAALAEPPPAEGLGIETAMQRAERWLMSYGTGNRHPRFWGWVVGGGTLAGILGQWLATAINANPWGGDQGPVHLELQVIEWLRRWYDFPAGASGLLVDGASSANLIGLAVARQRATDGAVRGQGLAGGPRLRVYCSGATHSSVIKAAELLGLGADAVRRIEPAPDGRADLPALERAIARDRAAGDRPFCLVASCGTVGTGAIDPMPALRALADREGLWFHVDGAIGALGWLAPSLRPRLEGVTTADSLAFDFHKWGQVPYDAGCVLVRDGALHRQTFDFQVDYLSAQAGGLTPRGAHNFSAHGPQLGRCDRALKIWTTLMAYGVDRFSAVFEANVAQAGYLGARVRQTADLELMTPVTLNIVCLRYRGGLPEGKAVDELNARILITLQESGFCVVSPYRHQGRFCLRAAFSNHRTQQGDVDAFVTELVRVGRAAEDAIAMLRCAGDGR